MALEKYRSKRNFKESPEPKGGKSAGKTLRFVIQKHAASHLHYDFRLEVAGVLKSWAVPKGPSTDPKVKRLAMMVEDHPYDYRNFEGIIPSGYGAGTVMVWDEGTYTIVEKDIKSKREIHRYIKSQLHSGKLHFVLKGKKLKGEFALVKTKGRGDNAWLFFKVKDKYASEEDVLKKDKSVISKLTLEQIAEKGRRRNSGKKEKRNTVSLSDNRMKQKKNSGSEGEKKLPAKKSSTQKNGSSLDEILNLKPVKKSRFSLAYRPMLATLVDKPFEEEGWVYEVKWDGYRALAFIRKGKVDLKSRNDKSFNEKFYPLVAALASWNEDAIVDGEIVVLNKKGISDFGALQNWRSETDGDLVFYAFDILWFRGRDLTGLTLLQRQRVLAEVFPQNDSLRISKSFSEDALSFFDIARQLGLEGIIAKKAVSEYHPGARSREWLKIKANKRQEVVIGGYTINNDTSKPFSALLAGVYQKGKLVYTGKIGTGFDTATQKKMLSEFSKIRTTKVPFSEIPDINKPSRFRPDPPNAEVFWLKPKLVCEVSFTELTSEGIMRHPSFQGMRSDKDAKDVVLEIEKPVDAILDSGKQEIKNIFMPARSKSTTTLLNPHEATQVKTIKGHQLKFTNLGKIYWPDEKITKRDLLNYYYNVAPYILPYLKNRPQSLNRHPNGIKGKSFYQKDVTGKVPDWIETYLYHSALDKRDKHFLVCTDEASLLYMASLGCIELNPWHSTVEHPDNPDWCIIDLDPANTTFDQVIEAAQVTKEILDHLGVKSYPKTSGSTGIHIYIPLGAKYTYEQSKEFARVIATLVHEQIPDFTSIERVVKKRKGKMYIDFLQNRDQATVSVAYSLRPKPGATVSMPLHWHEVKKGLRMSDFNIHNTMERLRQEGDIFKGVLGKGIDLAAIIKKFEHE